MDLVGLLGGDEVAIVAFFPKREVAVLAFFFGGGVGVDSGSVGTLSSQLSELEIGEIGIVSLPLRDALALVRVRSGWGAGIASSSTSHCPAGLATGSEVAGTNGNRI